MSQTHQPQRQRQLHRLLETGPEELPAVLPEIAQHPEVRAVPPRQVHEAEIFPAALLDLPGAEHAVTVGVDQDRNDLARRVGPLTPVAVPGLHFRRVQLLEQILIEETFVILRQEVEHVGRKQLTLAIVFRDRA